MNSAPRLSRRLSATDAAFLYLERPEIPLAIAAVFVLDGPVPFEDFVAHVDSRLPLLPRYRQIAVPPPFHLGHPTWEEYPRFNILDHIRRESLPSPGGEEQLEALAGRILGQVMDRNKPLWEIHIIEGLSGNRGAMIVRVHHALADGIAGAAILKILFDSSPEAPAPVPKPRISRLPPAPAEHSIVEALASAIHNSLKSMVAAEAALLDLGQALLGEPMQSGLQGLLGLLPEWGKAIDRLPFNRPCGGARKFCWTEIDLAAVNAVRDRLGGTVNEVILTVVTDAVSRYTKFHGQAVKDKFARIVCPVNIRAEGEQGSLGNQITFLPVVLPLGVREPAELLHAVIDRMHIMKSVRAAEVISIAAAWIAAMPPALQSMFWEGIPLIPLPVPLLNLICTNIPGSPTPLYALGRRIVASYPQVPTGYELGVGVAVQSYAGKLFFGLIADADAAPDVKRMRDFIQSSFRDLYRAAGLRKPPRRKPVRTAA